MDNETVNTVLSFQDVPLAALVPAVLLLLAVWVRSHAWSRRATGPWRVPAFCGRVGLGFLTLTGASGVAAHAVVFATGWLVWPILLAGAVLIEAVMAIGRTERLLVSRRAGIAISLLRAAAVLAVVIIMCQPVLVSENVRRINRRVAVLMDVSASMQVSDNNLTQGERLRLSETLGMPAARRAVRLDQVAVRLRDAGRDVAAQVDWLAAAAGTEPVLRGRRMDMNKSGRRGILGRARDAVADATNALAAAAAAWSAGQNDGVRPGLAGLSDRLAAEAGAPLDLAIRLADEWSPSSPDSGAAYDTLRQTLAKAAGALSACAVSVREAGEDVDGFLYRSLAEQDRKAVDQAASMRRDELVRRLLLGGKDAPAGGAAGAGLIERLDTEYGVTLYTFGAFPSECRVADMVAAGAGPGIPAPPDNQARGTDLAAILEKVAAGFQPGQAAGVILFSDGRHNAASPVEPVARKLGMQGVPVFPVVSGANRFPPTDAAVIGVDAPDSVSTNDRVSFSVNLKLDGLAGTNVTVTLFDGVYAVSSNTITPSASAFRTQILLSDVPKTAGLHAYRVAVQKFESEVDAGNNVSGVPVMVGEDAVKVLLLDGYPRWEFRYLKNLFMQGDRNVRLQYVLFHPDRVAGIGSRPARAAAADPGQAESEATLPPENEAEWMKFDVIILGDVAPDELGAGNIEILRRYVLNRGGALIVIAGSRCMPHAYANTPLAEILPVTFKPSNRPVLTAPEAEFRMALTAEGRNTLFMRLDDEDGRNDAVWNELPALHWRHGFLAAKEGATVLAYATTETRQPGAGRLGDVPDAGSLRRQQELERANPLVVTHRAGFGSVLMFGTDQSWRLRYRGGGHYHHKFWGQVLRWCTADRIAAGSPFVRIGTSSPRYPAGGTVRIVARLATPQFAPITDAQPWITIIAGDKQVLRRQLTYRAESPGVYAAEVDSLPEGGYRVELDTAGIRELAGAAVQNVSAEFSVTGAASPERVELAADRGLLDGLAELTGGATVDPPELDSLAARLGPATISDTERRQFDVWNSWPWLVLILALLTVEWVLRKRVRLP